VRPQLKHTVQRLQPHIHMSAPGGDIAKILGIFRWDFTKKNVEAMLQPLLPGAPADAVGAMIQIYETPFAVLCHFRSTMLSTRLIRVTLMAAWNARPDDVLVEKTWHRIKSDLIALYGQPRITRGDLSDPEEFRQSEQASWLTASSVVILGLGLLKDGVRADSPPITVTMGDREHDRASQMRAQLHR
jgi:hypothetical protein